MAGTEGQTAEETKKAESKLSKMLTRLAFGVPMICFFFVLVYFGHPYLVLLVVLLQVGLFRELVNVRYEPAKDKEVPFFRTLQWCMFFLAMWYTYTKTFVKLGLINSLMNQLPVLKPILLDTLRYKNFLTFSAYVGMFVGFVLSLKKGMYQYQIGNLVWTVGVLCMIVWQIAGTADLIFAGLFWFMLPCGLVVANDCWAYFSGMLLGRRLIKAEFLSISPNKTWEGFIGAAILTAIWAWLYSDWISRSHWLVCPQEDLVHYASLSCRPSNVFVKQNISLPYDDYTLFVVEAKPCQLHALVLALFASVVAPFGGFLASAIKRAYDIKDFDSFIPGHGGLMDRMDCMFLMLLCTLIHYNTFVKESNLTDAQIEGRLVDTLAKLSPEKQAKVFHRIFLTLKPVLNCRGDFTCSGQ
jgi:phosphatidate cytidylyltransferase